MAQAYKLWLQKETRTDDITCAVIWFDHQQDAAIAAAGTAHGNVLPQSADEQQSTPPQVAEHASRLGLLRTPSGKQANDAAEVVAASMIAATGGN